LARTLAKADAEVTLAVSNIEAGKILLMKL
jgi:hypothetical protein